MAHKSRLKKRSTRQQRMCGTKIQYEQPSMSDDVARLLSLNTIKPISSYECPYCHFFHVGHTPYQPMSNKNYRKTFRGGQEQ
jgi:hypothetical protein